MLSSVAECRHAGRANAASFAFDGARSQVPSQEDVFYGGAHMARHASNHIKSSRRKARAVLSKNSLPQVSPFAQRTDMKDRSASTCCVAGGSRGNAFKVRPSHDPIRTRSRPDQAVPANRGVKIVEQKAIRARLARGSLESAAHSHPISIATRRSLQIESRYTSIAPSV